MRVAGLASELRQGAAAARAYRVRCQGCGLLLEDDGLMLECPREHSPALLVSEYGEDRLNPDTEAQGMSRYRSWLPSCRPVEDGGQLAVYRSESLGRVVGCEDLWIAFSGYWPERGATLDTCSFKELEARAVLARLPYYWEGVLVVASAGNTAAAFASLCSERKVPCLVILPESGLNRLQMKAPLQSCVRIVSVGGGADYLDAINFAQQVCSLDGFVPEGGVKNIARRDGIGTVMLRAAEVIGHLPEYYFQAVGSGTGGIAVHETARRLIRDGRFGTKGPRLFLSQNWPFAPMYKAWTQRRADLEPIDREQGRKEIREVAADVLTNQSPPYAVAGGVRQVLEESCGEMLVAGNEQVRQAMALFEVVEGIDIEPAAGVALATLAQAVRGGMVDRKAPVLLHVTGGGRQRQAREREPSDATADMEVDVRAAHDTSALCRIEGLYA